MMKIGPAVAAAAVFAIASPVCAQDAVQWRVEDGGNGHWYALTSSSGTWGVVKLACEGLGGHLATLTTASENSFAAPLAGPGTAWIGGFQPPNSCEPLCDWRWVTGEAWGYSAWAPTEPNEFGSGEDVSETYASGGWADMPNSGWIRRGIIEWSADCNSDGIVDYGQIRAGELADTNANNIPDCCETGTVCGCPADVILDGVVNGIDLAVIINAWSTDGGKFPRADIDGNGFVDGADLAIVLGSWGPCS
jgi:hypothetical protein